MNTIDPMVLALIALCKAEGGERFVADKAVVSAENLLQITKGVKLPSGNPRGVGPGLRAKITKAYPGWLSASATTNDFKQNQPLALIDNAQAAINNAATLAQITQALSTYFEAMDDNTKGMTLDLLARLAKDPKDHARIAAMIELSIHSKRQKVA